MKKHSLKYLTRNAFTMIELVFVIVVIGILAAVIIPNTRTNPLQEAAIQLISHLRYTQHLAIANDTYDAGDANWYKKRWQLVVGNSVPPDSSVSYTIFSDTALTSTGDADITEIAINPENPSKVLSGGYSATLPTSDPRMTRKLNLEASYGITSITFGGGCNQGTRLPFDNLGRPLKGDMSGNTEAYENDNLIRTRCNITLNSSSGSIVIAVEPETGFACILDSAGNCI